MQFWGPSARFICKNTTFLLSKLFSRMKLKFWLFWGPQEPYGAFREQNSHKMDNCQYIEQGKVSFGHILPIFWNGKEKKAIFSLKHKNSQGGSLRPPPMRQRRRPTRMRNRVNSWSNISYNVTCSNNLIWIVIFITNIFWTF